MPSPTPDARHATAGMVDYNENSPVQLGVVLSQAVRIRALTDSLGRVDPELRIADFGCGPGQSAIEAVRPAIEAYRAHFPTAPIAVRHADQPGNDWNALFALANGPTGYLPGSRALRTEAAIGSFYDPMAAPGSVSLATCFAASHWLDRSPHLQAPDSLWFADLRGAAREEMAAVARQDWRRFLASRARELRSGGALLVCTLGAVPEAGEANGTAASGRGIYRALQLVAQEMADEGLIDREALDGFVFGLWFLTAEEAREPLESDRALAEAFAVEELEIVETPRTKDIFAEALGEPERYAALYVGYTRAFAETTLRAELFGPSTQSEAEAEALEQEFFRRFEALYRENPGAYACEIWPLTVVLRRR